MGNAVLDKPQAQADAKAAAKVAVHVEIDTIAMLLAAHDRLQVGPGRADGLINDFLAWKLEIAGAVVQELAEDQSKKKELVMVQRDLAVRVKEVLGPAGWEKWKTLFPFLRDYW